MHRHNWLDTLKNPLQRLRRLSLTRSSDADDSEAHCRQSSTTRAVCPICSKDYISTADSVIHSPCCSEQCSQTYLSVSHQSAGRSSTQPATSPGHPRRSFSKLLSNISRRSSTKISESHISSISTPDPTNSLYEHASYVPTSPYSSFFHTTTTRSPPMSPSTSQGNGANSPPPLSPQLTIPYQQTTKVSLQASMSTTSELPSPTKLYQFESMDLSGRVRKLDPYPFETGGVADLYNGISLVDGTMVAIKIFRRLHTDGKSSNQTRRHLYEAARTWCNLRHENLLPFLGVCHDVGPSVALISPLCSRGPIIKYLQNNDIRYEEKLIIAIGIAKGLAYLHSEGLIHGNLSTSKILVGDTGSPVICSYGLPQVPGQLSPVTPPLRYSAPECLTDETQSELRKSTATDVYSLSMVVLEIFSGRVPYHNILGDHSVLLCLVRGDRPSRDTLGSDSSLFPNSMWMLLVQMWNQHPAFRPNMEAVLRRLMAIQSGEVDNELVDENPEPPISPPDIPLLQVEDVDSQLGTGIPSSSDEEIEETSYGGLPGISSQYLKGKVLERTGEFPFAHGGNSNLYRGTLTLPDGRKIHIAIKMIRISEDVLGQADEITKKLKREAAIWSGLNHKNLLPFIGVCDYLSPWPVLVSPFYDNGHIEKYLKTHSNANRNEMILGVASGLEYLHANNVVHGDLKAQNVLIDKHGNPCICDFGISKVTGSRGFTTVSVGTVPYMAPELFFVLDGLDHDGKLPATTKSSDVYSFALVALQILTSRPPKRRPVRPIITSKVHSELRPQRLDYDSPRLNNEVWDILDECWAFEASTRPSMEDLIGRLPNSLPQPILEGSREDADKDTSDTFTFSEIDH